MSLGPTSSVRTSGAREMCMQKVRELVEFACGQGYAVDELVEMIEDGA